MKNLVLFGFKGNFAPDCLARTPYKDLKPVN